MKFISLLLLQLLYSVQSVSLQGIFKGGIGLGITKRDRKQEDLGTSANASASRSPRYLINEQWQELGEGIGGEKLDDLAGYRVATNKDGTIIAVSSPRWVKPGGYGRDPFGRVRVYKFEPETDRWIKMGKDIMGEEFDEFGTSLAIDADGKNVVVGMINDPPTRGRDAGTVRVYSHDDNTGDVVWIQKGRDLVGETSFEQFGAAVDISGDGRDIAVGAPYKDVGDEPEAGLVRVYRYEPNANKWAKVGTDLAGLVKFDHFGAALSFAADGNALAVGAPNALDYNTGEVRVFLYDFDEADWIPHGTVAGENMGDMFGSSVDLFYNNGHLKFIGGSPHHDGGNALNKESGQARVFYDDNGEWILMGQAILGLNAGDHAGSSVSIAKDDGLTIAIGSPNSSQNGKHSGHANVWYFDSDDKLWKQQGLDIDGGQPLDLLGSDVALSDDGTELIAGAPGGEYAKIYALSATPSPTMAPTTAAPTNTPTPEHRNYSFVQFLKVVAIGGLIILFGLGLYKSFIMCLRRRRGHVPTPTEMELELQTVQRGPEEAQVSEGNELI